ncbi:hydroxycarboxylic acid receptor 2/3 [Sarotherodon galilaeus]
MYLGYHVFPLFIDIVPLFFSFQIRFVNYHPSINKYTLKMASRWSRRRKLRSMVEAAQSDILRHFEEMVGELNIQSDNAQVEVKRPRVAEESGVSHCCHPGIDRPNPLYTYADSEDEQPQKKRFPQAPRVKIPAPATPQSAPQPTDSNHHNAPPSFRHLSPLQHNTQADTALRSPQHVESDVSAVARDDSRVSVRPLLQDATLHKILTMVSDLTRAVHDLREEVRAIRHPCSNESIDAGVLPLDLPLHNMEELNNAEAALQSPEANKAMVRRFALIGGTTLEVRVRRVMAYAITNELASVLNWAGKKNKDQTKQKRAFKETVLCKCIFDGLTQQVGANSMSEFVFAQAVQKWLRYAPDRMGGAGRPTSIPILE